MRFKWSNAYHRKGKLLPATLRRTELTLGCSMPLKADSMFFSSEFMFGAKFKKLGIALV